MSAHRFYVEADVLRVVVDLQRRGYGRIYPKMIQPHLPYYRTEQTLRRDMMSLTRRGYLERLGGEKSRRGYRAVSVALRAVA